MKRKIPWPYLISQQGVIIAPQLQCILWRNPINNRQRDPGDTWRLVPAWDQQKKVYVQNLMLEHGGQAPAHPANPHAGISVAFQGGLIPEGQNVEWFAPNNKGKMCRRVSAIFTVRFL